MRARASNTNTSVLEGSYALVWLRGGSVAERMSSLGSVESTRNSVNDGRLCGFLAGAESVRSRWRWRWRWR